MNTTIEIELELSSKDALGTLLNKSDPSPGCEREIPETGVQIRVTEAEDGAGFTDAFLATLVITVATGISSSILANLIYDALGAALRKLTVDRRRVRPTREELEKALETVLVLKQRGNSDED